MFILRMFILFILALERCGVVAGREAGLAPARPVFTPKMLHGVCFCCWILIVSFRDGAMATIAAVTIAVAIKTDRPPLKGEPHVHGRPSSRSSAVRFE